MKLICCAGAFIAFDVLTGLVKALYHKTFNSSVMREGGFHKSVEILALFFAWGMEYAVSIVELGFEVPLLGAVSTYLCVMETISVLENLSSVNPQLKKLFAPYLAKFK